MGKTLFEQITESPVTFVDWLLSEELNYDVDIDGPDVSIEISISFEPALLPGLWDDVAETEDMECAVADLTDEEYGVLKQTLLDIFTKEG